MVVAGYCGNCDRRTLREVGPCPQCTSKDNKTITISNEAAEFILNLVDQIDTQDCRGTASPYYYVVRGVNKLTAAEGRGSTHEYYDPDIGESYTEDMLIDHCEENDLDIDEYKENIELVEMQEVEEDVNVFFTYEGYKKHIELNGHNYGHFERFYSYAKYADRNPEIEGLIKTIREIAGAIKIN